jgi:hypothetical protein
MQHSAEREQMKHTPGPWEFVPKLTASENHKGFFVRAEKATKNGKWALAEVQPGNEDGKLGEANARLIAAAPDLLKACAATMAGYPGRQKMIEAAYNRAVGAA